MLFHLSKSGDGSGQNPEKGERQEPTSDNPQEQEPQIQVDLNPAYSDRQLQPDDPPQVVEYIQWLQSKDHLSRADLVHTFGTRFIVGLLSQSSRLSSFFDKQGIEEGAQLEIQVDHLLKYWDHGRDESNKLLKPHEITAARGGRIHEEGSEKASIDKLMTTIKEISQKPEINQTLKILSAHKQQIQDPEIQTRVQMLEIYLVLLRKMQNASSIEDVEWIYIESLRHFYELKKNHPRL